MIDIPELDIRASREIAKRITEDIQRAYEDFGLGKWINRLDAGATGMAAVLIQAKIAGLSDALKHIQETDRDLTGRAPKKEARLHG